MGRFNVRRAGASHLINLPDGLIRIRQDGDGICWWHIILVKRQYTSRVCACVDLLRIRSSDGLILWGDRFSRLQERQVLGDPDLAYQTYEEWPCFGIDLHFLVSKDSQLDEKVNCILCRNFQELNSAFLENLMPFPYKWEELISFSLELVITETC
jgi:hypothetical protein